MTTARRGALATRGRESSLPRDSNPATAPAGRGVLHHTNPSRQPNLLLELPPQRRQAHAARGEDERRGDHSAPRVDSRELSTDLASGPSGSPDLPRRPLTGACESSPICARPHTATCPAIPITDDYRWPPGNGSAILYRTARLCLDPRQGAVSSPGGRRDPRTSSRPRNCGCRGPAATPREPVRPHLAPADRAVTPLRQYAVWVSASTSEAVRGVLPTDGTLTDTGDLGPGVASRPSPVALHELLAGAHALSETIMADMGHSAGHPLRRHDSPREAVCHRAQVRLDLTVARGTRRAGTARPLPW